MTAGDPLKNVGEAFEKAGGGMAKAMQEGVFRGAVHAAGELKTEVHNTFRKGRTGQLSQSFKPEPMLDLQWPKVGAQAVSRLVHAGILNRGGTIYPRSVRALPVPVNQNIAVGKWPRHFGRGELG